MKTFIIKTIASVLGSIISFGAVTALIIWLAKLGEKVTGVNYFEIATVFLLVVIACAMGVIISKKK